jgi:hypothetical protein
MSWRDRLVARFKPNRDLWAVGASWLLVTGSLSAAAFIVTAQNQDWVFALVGECGT